MRGKSNYLVDVYHDEEEESMTYGPYTYKQAVAEVKRIQEFYRREAVACDIDPEEVEHEIPHVMWYRIGRWSPPPMQSTPTRPPCPLCGVKMNIWNPMYTDNDTHGICNNRECEDYQKVDHILVEQDGKWIIQS